MKRTAAQLVLSGTLLAAPLCGVSVGTAAAQLPPTFGHMAQYCTDDNAIYKEGSPENACVKAMQEDLPSMLSGFKPIKLAADGKYGPDTAAAVRTYQSENGDAGPVDGIAGPKTLKSMKHVESIGVIACRDLKKQGKKC